MVDLPVVSRKLKALQVYVSEIEREPLGDFQMARFRNLLVHGYENVEDRITYDVARERLGDFRLFARVVEDYLQRGNAPGAKPSS